jgi:hypothetical protein
VQLTGLDAEQYTSPEEFAASAFSDSRSLASIQSIGIAVAVPAEDVTGAIVLNRQYGTPAVELAVEGSDRVIVGGIEEELERAIAPGSPRIPRPNAAVFFLVGAVLGTVFGFAIAYIDWSFISNDILRAIVVAGAYILGYGLLLFAITRGPNWVLPQLELFREGERPRWDRYRVRVFAVIGASFATILGIALKAIFG